MLQRYFCLYSEYSPYRWNRTGLYSSTYICLQNRIMDVIPNLLFCILLPNVSGQHLHVTKELMTGQQCNKSTTNVDVNQLPHSSKEDVSCAVEVGILQRNFGSKSSSKETKIPEPDDWGSSMNVPSGYAAYRDYFIRKSHPFKLM